MSLLLTNDSKSNVAATTDQTSPSKLSFAIEFKAIEDELCHFYWFYRKKKERKNIGCCWTVSDYGTLNLDLCQSDPVSNCFKRMEGSVCNIILILRH